MSLKRYRIPIAITATVAAVTAGGIVALTISPSASEASCAPGFRPVTDLADEVRAEMSREDPSRERDDDEDDEQSDEFKREMLREFPALASIPASEWSEHCMRVKRPESLNELAMMAGAQAMPRMAPYGAWAQGAYSAAVAERAVMKPGLVNGTSGTGAPYGVGPLIVNDPRYPQVNGLGLVHNAGRVDDFAYDPAGKRLFAAVGTGGIWSSTDWGKTWHNASGNLPTTVTGAIAWTSANGGTLVALTGEPTFGSAAYTGIGAYYSIDGGTTWSRASGVPDGALGFRVAVDPADPSKVYAATQLGLFVSTDGGKTYANAKLPTGQCAGVTDVSANGAPTCALANVVTDVVVVAPGGVGTKTTAGTVLAAVGWRGGNRKNADGSVQSPNNGLYRSATGAPGSFAKLSPSGFVPPDNIGRMALGAATGAAQNHDVIYAMVQDAKLLNNGGVIGVDISDTGATSPLGTTVLNGLYVSTDFGSTWKLLASGTTLAADPASGSALVGTGTATGYQPGVQGWYNLYVRPDPTRTSLTGVPTRLLMGLEEIWAPETSLQPLDGLTPVHFKVVGKYFGGASCLLLRLGLPACPGDREPLDPENQTTHPDQHAAIWVADPSTPGGVQLLVGNDGGVYRYRFDQDADRELDNTHWGPGDNDGFGTLLPYYAAMAKDGTVWAGLQDNGNLRIDPINRKQYETYGGDGFFTAVDPDNSNVAYEEYTNGAISVTTDGGTTWKSINPSLTAPKFSNPFAMDPTDGRHLITAGREVVETTRGPETGSGHAGTGNQWAQVFDLGTRTRPGDPAATASSTDPANSMSAIAVHRDAAYVGFCGQCDTLNKLAPTSEVFKNGLATNVGGPESPAKGTAKGWHVVAAAGLPNRYITAIAIDPSNPKNVFVTLGGYTRRWVPPGAVGDTNATIGTGHLYRSTDSGQTFTDISGNLPDSPATWVALRGQQLLVGTDVGAFASGLRAANTTGPAFAPLNNLPTVPITNIGLKPGDPDTAVIATYGRGVWTYAFDKKVKLPTTPSPTPEPQPTITQPYASYDFESGTQNWTVSTPATWRRGAPGEKNGTDDASGNAYALSGAAYLDLADTSLISPSVSTQAGTTVLQFALKLDTEPGYDGVSVDWSVDGKAWTAITTLTGRSDSWPGWQTRTTTFTSPGGPVQVRFRFQSDELCSGTGGPLCSSPNGWDGVHIDNVVIGR
ncbi:hypothetical protein ACNAW0_15085 [Micromonospora sp. SL1-18]|uniref:hypothetical protein n=1 Tax=Micromonospora sp. SL1-18 TaxID=3399128 RepID=UPI003A4D372A